MNGFLLKIVRPLDTVYCLLFQHKTDKTWSFINLTKKHICSCKFKSYEEAIDDLENEIKKGKVLYYEYIKEYNIKQE